MYRSFVIIDTCGLCGGGVVNGIPWMPYCVSLDSYEQKSYDRT